MLRGEYGATPAPVDPDLQSRVLQPSEEPITCRPADNLTAELDRLTEELEAIARERTLKLVDPVIDDVLIYAMFPQVGLKFIQNRDNPAARGHRVSHAGIGQLGTGSRGAGRAGPGPNDRISARRHHRQDPGRCRSDGQRR